MSSAASKPLAASRRQSLFPLPVRETERHSLARRLPRLSSNPVSARNFRRFRQLISARTARPRALVIGGARVGVGAGEALAAPEIRWVESDVALGDRTALVADTHELPFEDETFDGVVAQAILEHVVEPAAVVAEIQRVLKPGGVVYAETPFLQAVHAGPYDFTRWTPLGHRRLFRWFDEIDSGAAGGPGATLAWAYQGLLLSFAPGRSGRKLATATARLTAFWLPWLDHWLHQRPAALDSASACYFLGAKSPAPLDDRELIAGYRGAQR